MQTPDYYFGRTEGGDVAGFNDPVAANFAYEGDLTDSLVRESIQNIIDARLPGESPARVEFDLKTVPVQSLPGSSQLEMIFRKCADYAEKRKVVPATEHYRAQAELLKNGGDIPMLRIADSNTCGLTGDTEDGRWFMFMRGVGFNAGEAGAGGAFGLGKGAFFANSLFKSIFVSTVTSDGIKFGGKLRLVSFEKDGELMQGNGTFGLRGQLPLTERRDIPEMFRRDGQGTDIWVVNFVGSEDWQGSISRAVLSWFWPAIHWGIVSVRVGEIEFNAKNLRERMGEFFSPDERKSTKPFNPIHFYDTYIDPERKLTKNFATIGDASFFGRTVTDLPYPNKTALVRNTGMIIDFKSRSSYLSKYAAVFECRDAKGSEILRKLENPSHTEWNWHNWKDENGCYVAKGKNANSEFEEFIADGLAGLLYAPVTQSTNIPGLAEYIGLPTKDGSITSIGEVKNEIQEAVEEETGIEIGSDGEDKVTSVHTIRPVRVAQCVKVEVDDFPTPTPKNTHVKPQLNNHLNSSSTPDSEGKSVGSQDLKNASVRYVMSDKTESGRIYRVIIHTDNNIGRPVVRIRLYARADNGSFELLQMADVKGERGTEIVNVAQDYCDFTLDDSGAAHLSVQLDIPWILALEPNLRVLI